MNDGSTAGASAPADEDDGEEEVEDEEELLKRAIAMSLEDPVECG